jgi:flagellar protein FliL
LYAALFQIKIDWSMAEEQKAEEKPAEAVPAPAGNNKLVMILTLVNVLVTFGIVGMLFVSFKKEQTQPRVTDIVADADSHGGDGAAKDDGHVGGGGDKGAKHAPGMAGKMVTLEQFTVNLSVTGTGTQKFARVNISVELPTEDTEAEVNQKMPQVRNAIIDLFNSKRPTDLATPEGRNYLKEEIRNALNSFLVTGKIKGVFFTSFNLSG